MMSGRKGCQINCIERLAPSAQILLKVTRTALAAIAPVTGNMRSAPLAQRNLALREGRAEYSVITNPTEDDQDTQDSVTTEDLADLLSTVPLPDL